MGRYIERSEGTIRLLLEMHQLLVSEGESDQRRGASIIMHGLGFVPPVSVTLADLVMATYGTPQQPSTILGSLEYARTNARSVRDALPADFFEVLNKVHMRARVLPNPRYPGTTLRDILEGLAVVHGVFDWVSPRDEAHAFYELGGYLERIDLVGRLLRMRIERGWPEQGPATVLRSVAGLNTYLRRHEKMSGGSVREFLLLDPTFPRSIIRSALEAETCIRFITAMTSSRPEPVLKSIAVLRSQLEYEEHLLDDEDCEIYVDQSLRAVDATSIAIRDNYFRPVGSIVWSH
jgi:uncharacterized alpha-E superfamily protein